MYNSRYAITFGEVSIVHIGSKQMGRQADNGISIQQLEDIQNKLKDNNIESELIRLNEQLPQKWREGNQAAVLHIPGGANHLLEDEKAGDQLYEEQQAIEYDKKYYDSRMKRTLNKRARYNIVFGQEQQEASEDYKQFSVKAFSNLKYLSQIREKIGSCFGLVGLRAEGNKYFEEGSGIGFHGDGQRKIVICLSLGRSSILRYCWRKPGSSSNASFEPIDINVRHGDIYLMSEKATGNDWKKRSLFRLVHAAGSRKYIQV